MFLDIAGIPLHDGQGTDVMRGSIGPKHVKLCVEFSFVAQCQLDFFVAALPILRMNASLPGLVSPGKLISRDAVEVKHLLVPDQSVVNHVVIPDAYSARAYGQCQPVGNLAQSLLRSPAFSDIACRGVQVPPVLQRNPAPVDFHLADGTVFSLVPRFEVARMVDKKNVFLLTVLQPTTAYPKWSH